MSYPHLLGLFTGRLDSQKCARYILSLKSPQNVAKFLVRRHEILFPDGDGERIQRWDNYTKGLQGEGWISRVQPVTSKDLSNADFLTRTARKLSFDISRFTEFLSAYDRVNEDIKPMMFHYALIYVLDFFSRTWLKYGRNRGHGLQPYPQHVEEGSANIEIGVRVLPQGIFPRAVDAFYLVHQSSLFSCDDANGVAYKPDLNGYIVPKGIEKQKYCDKPRILLSQLVDIYDSLNSVIGYVKISNQILVGYMIIFALSSICRYLPEQWFKVHANRDLSSRLEIMQSDYLYNWIPEILLQLELERDVLNLDLKKPSLEDRFGFLA